MFGVKVACCKSCLVQKAVGVKDVSCTMRLVSTQLESANATHFNEAGGAPSSVLH